MWTADEMSAYEQAAMICALLAMRRQVGSIEYAESRRGKICCEVSIHSNEPTRHSDDDEHWKETNSHAACCAFFSLVWRPTLSVRVEGTRKEVKRVACRPNGNNSP